MNPYKIVMCFIVFTPMASAQPSAQVLDAIKMVESGGRENPPDGDGGRSIGPYQIMRAYHADAIAHDKTLGGTYEDCRKEPYARKVVIAYLTRYAKNATPEQMGRCHNSGPSWRKKYKLTNEYAKKFIRAYNKIVGP